MMKKVLPIVIIIALLLIVSIIVLPPLISFWGTNAENQSPTDSLPDIDGNPYTTHEIVGGETYVSYDYSPVYDTLDLSQYDNHGTFGTDGLMWVEKSDYTGKQFGYIDYNGNIVIPFTSKIVKPGDFNSGYAIIAYETDIMDNGIYSVINTKGETIFEFENRSCSLHYQSSNGNIVFIDINLIENINSSETKDYILCSNTGKVIEIIEESCSYYSSHPMLYSNGLLKTYRTVWESDAIEYIDVVTFYDENGNEALTIDTNSSEYFEKLLYVEDFVDEESVVYFYGLDQNYYTVRINKSGEWLSEPIEIDKEDAQFFN